jgi:hypothetical protein
MSCQRLKFNSKPANSNSCNPTGRTLEVRGHRDMTAKIEKQGEREKTLFLHIRVKAGGWTDNYSSAFTLCTLQGTHKKVLLLGI